METLTPCVDTLFKDYQVLSDVGKKALVKLKYLIDEEVEKTQNYVSLKTAYIDLLEYVTEVGGGAAPRKAVIALKYLMDDNTYIHELTPPQILRVPNVGRKALNCLNEFLLSKYNTKIAY